MAWRVEFLLAADKAFGKLDRQQQRRIQKFIETRLQMGLRLSVAPARR